MFLGDSLRLSTEEKHQVNTFLYQAHNPEVNAGKGVRTVSCDCCHQQGKFT
jgi:hypothetical protein